ncbi:hypothetical protein LOZ80_14835 [Paenibacillus sp. HWE-109]|uniref:hypothetical protein n=1 Tax=Paenibacillus sp. HWE-109 TaxID=1306526 RepID=UPI001EE0CD2E|nr:hypothetical protein [Paenibacillus sp. HWE-109]UKS30136.1 hypothetical protein LOZ80_14835 [Paenibacillus sp. HWE-109]
MSATNEEMTLIRESVILPFLLPIIARNITELENGKGKDALLNRLYLAATQALHDDIEADIRAIKKTLKEQDIRVWEDDKRSREVNARYYRFVVRGYEENFGIMREIARAEISTRLKLYVRKIEKAFSQRR